MTTPFEDVLKSHYPTICYGYETIYEEVRPTREEYDIIFQQCVEEHKELLMDMVREQRKEILARTDVCLLPDYPITNEERARVIEYRQKLRDITKGELPKMTRVDYVLEFDLSRESVLADTPAVIEQSADLPVKLVVDETEPTSNLS